MEHSTALRHILLAYDDSDEADHRFLTKVGRPPQQIVAQAEEVRADLIVMGHRPRSFVARGFRQSTAARVMETAGCPILIVP